MQPNLAFLCGRVVWTPAPCSRREKWQLWLIRRVQEKCDWWLLTWNVSKNKPGCVRCLQAVTFYLVFPRYEICRSCHDVKLHFSSRLGGVNAALEVMDWLSCCSCCGYWSRPVGVWVNKRRRRTHRGNKEDCEISRKGFLKRCFVFNGVLHRPIHLCPNL